MLIKTAGPDCIQINIADGPVIEGVITSHGRDWIGLQSVKDPQAPITYINVVYIMTAKKLGLVEN